MILREGRSPAPLNNRALRAMQMQTNKVKRMLPSVSYVIALWRTAAAPNSCEKRRDKLNETALVCKCIYVYIYYEASNA